MEKNEMEFSEMKEQLRVLQNRLNEQIDINEKHLRKALAENVSGLRRHDFVGVVFCFLACFFVTGLVATQGLSLTFIVATFVFLLANAIASLLLKFNNHILDSTDLVTMSENALKYKERQRNYLFIGIPAALVWSAWYLFELGQQIGFKSPLAYIGMGCAMGIGAVVGFIIGYLRFYRPSIRKADKILANIKDLQEK